MRDAHSESKPWPPRTDDDYRQEAVIILGEELADRLARVRLMVFDADGVSDARQPDLQRRRGGDQGIPQPRRVRPGDGPFGGHQDGRC